MIYEDYNFPTSFSIPAWSKIPPPSSKICISSLTMAGQLGFKKASPRYRKNVDIPRNPVTVKPNKYKILKAAGNVTIKNTNKCDMTREMLYDFLFATGVHYKDIGSESYKFFPVKEPLEFTLGFTERENEMEVL